MPFARRATAVACVAALIPLAAFVSSAGADRASAVAVGFGRGMTIPPPGSSCAGLYELVVPSLDAPLCTHGGDATPQALAATSSSTPAGSVFCYGDGVTGRRVELLYVHAAGVSDRFTSVATELRALAAGADGVFDDSARPAGQIRHLRFAVDSQCRPVIHDVSVPATSDDTFSNTITAVRALGYTSIDRKYVMFVDSNQYCGIANMPVDDRPWSNNMSLFGVGYARIDRDCWNPSVTAHEIVHTLGGVHATAPHTSGAGHCYDGNDVLCYADGGPYFAHGGVMHYPCPTTTLLDCNNDDYFLAGGATSGYLANHWNVAQSGFLETADGSTAAPGPALAPPPLPDAPLATQQWDGSLMPFSDTTANVMTAAGDAVATINTDNELTATIRLDDGTVLASRHGTGTFDLASHVPRATIVIDLTDGMASNYTVTFRYPPR